MWDKKNQELNRQANIFFTYRQKDSHASPKAIQQIYFLGGWKNVDNTGIVIDACADQSMFFLTILEKVKETRLKLKDGKLWRGKS